MDVLLIFSTIFLYSYLPRSTNQQDSSSTNLIQFRTSVSDSLDDLLTSWNSEKIIQNLANLTKKYEEYTPEDVAKVANLLSKCEVETLNWSQNPTGNLQAVVDVVSNLQEIDSVILKESNSLYDATNNILTHAVRIIHGFNYGQVIGNAEMSSKNFFLNTVRDKLFSRDYFSYYTLLKNSISGEYTFIRNNSEDYLEHLSDLELMFRPYTYDASSDFFYVLATVFVTPKLFISQNEVNLIGPIIHAHFIHYNYEDISTTESSTSESSTETSTITDPPWQTDPPLWDQNPYIDDIGRRVPPSEIYFLYKVETNQELNCNFWNNGDMGNTGPFWDVGNYTRVQMNNTYSVASCNFCPHSDFKSASNFAMLVSRVTDQLEDLLNSSKPTDEKISDLSEISERFDEFEPEDIELIGGILEKISWDPDINLNNFSNIVNNILRVDRDVLATSQADHQTTDTLLKQIDKILINQRDDRTNQTTQIDEEYFKIVISNTTMTGVLLFNDYNVVEIYDKAIEDWSQYKNVISGVRLNSELKNQPSGSKIIVTIFMKDGLFNEKKRRDPLNHVYGVILPENFQHESPLSLIQNQSLFKDRKQGCTFWKYGTSGGFWQIDLTGRLTTVVNELSICDYWHTTHFACLLLDSPDLNARDIKILEWITTINCSLSIFGISLIFLTAILFKTWRNKTGNRILINFAIALAFQIAAFYISDAVNNLLEPKTEKSVSCTISGVLLHYSIISQFCWMLVIASLQYKRFVQVLGGPPNHLLLKSTMCGWILPILPVVSVLASDCENYVRSQVGLCYPSGLGLYLGVWLPVFAILTTNVVIFSLIVYHVVFSKSECASVSSEEDVFYQWRLVALLFFLLGINWIFGFLSQINSDVVFVYFFTLTATLQGFLMFLFFVAFHGTTKSLYVKAFKKIYDNFGSDRPKFHT